MDTSTHILVIILSIMLAIFLLLGIAVAVQIVRLLKTINRIAEKAEAVVDTAEHVGQIFQNVGSKVSLLNVIHNIANVVTEHNKRKKS